MISFLALHRSGLARVQQLALSPRATALPLAGSSHADTAMSPADAGRNAAPATRGVFLHAAFLLRALAALMLVLASFICAPLR
jgi:hypothetical protein